MWRRHTLEAAEARTLAPTIGLEALDERIVQAEARLQHLGSGLMSCPQDET